MGTASRLLLLLLHNLLLLLPPPGAFGFVPSLDSDFTFTLPAGRKECFFQPMRQGASLEVEYQVRGPGSGRATVGGAGPASSAASVAESSFPARPSRCAAFAAAASCGARRERALQAEQGWVLSRRGLQRLPGSVVRKIY